MTLDEERDALRDLQLALHTTTSLQQTIRHADTKAQVLLGVQGGVAVIVVQHGSALSSTGMPVLLAVAGVLVAAWLAGLAVSSWHLLMTMAPRLASGRRENRFAVPATRPASADLGHQRDEAWDLVSTLADIAAAKHLRVRRSLPALIFATASGSALLALAVIEGATA